MNTINLSTSRRISIQLTVALCFLWMASVPLFADLAGDTLDVTAVDFADNQASETVQFVFDPDPPEMIVAGYPPAGQTLVKPGDTFEITLSDSLSGLDTGENNINISIAGDDALGLISVWENGVLKYEASVRNMGMVDDVSYTMNFQAQDMVGNILNDAVTIEYDAVPPDVVLIEPGRRSIGNAVRVVYRLSELCVDPVELIFQPDGGGADILLNMPGLNQPNDLHVTAFVDPPLVNGQSYTVTVRATDMAGNIGESHVYGFLYDAEHNDIAELEDDGDRGTWTWAGDDGSVIYVDKDGNLLRINPDDPFDFSILAEKGLFRNIRDISVSTGGYFVAFSAIRDRDDYDVFVGRIKDETGWLEVVPPEEWHNITGDLPMGAGEYSNEIRPLFRPSQPADQDNMFAQWLAIYTDANPKLPSRTRWDGVFIRRVEDESLLALPGDESGWMDVFGHPQMRDYRYQWLGRHLLAVSGRRAMQDVATGRQVGHRLNIIYDVNSGSYRRLILPVRWDDWPAYWIDTTEGGTIDRLAVAFSAASSGLRFDDTVGPGATPSTANRVLWLMIFQLRQDADSITLNEAGQRGHFREVARGGIVDYFHDLSAPAWTWDLPWLALRGESGTGNYLAVIRLANTLDGLLRRLQAQGIMDLSGDDLSDYEAEFVVPSAPGRLFRPLWSDAPQGAPEYHRLLYRRGRSLYIHR